MIKKKSHVRKYSRKIKNKKVKCSRKLLRGGSMRSPKSYSKNPFAILNIENNNNNNNNNKLQKIHKIYVEPKYNKREHKELTENNKNQGKWKIIGDSFKSLKFKYECENKFYKYKNTITIGKNTYNKYKCFPIKRTEGTIKEQYSIIYENTETGETFKVYENTNQSIGIEYNEDKVFKQKGTILQITPIELNVDTMQLAINTNSLYVSHPDKKGNVYIGFINNFPSLNVKVSNSSFKYSSRLHAEWISVYEDDTTLLKEDQKFNLIKTTDGQYIDENTFNDANITISMSQQQTGQPLLKKDPIELNVHYTNEGLFKSRINKLRELLNNRQILPDVKKDAQLKLENQIKYRANVKIDNDNGTTSENRIGENIGWVAKNVLWLEQYLKLKNAKLMEGYHKNRDSQSRTNDNNEATLKQLNNKLKFAEQSNNLIVQRELKKQIEQISIDKNFNKWKKTINIYDEQYNIGLPNVEPLNRKEYECDLSGLDEKYIIIDEYVNEGDGEEYVICGYPEDKMKEIILNFWQNKNMSVEFDKVHQEQKDTNSKSFLDLFIYYKTKEFEINNPNKKIEIKEPYTECDLYIRQVMIEYIEKRYNALYKDNPNDTDYTNFKVNFKKNAKEYFQKIALKYLPKPMVFIKYVFIVFIKKQNNNDLEPFIFNVKELIPEHTNILKQIERLIKHELSYRFGILSDAEYNNGIGNDTDPFDDEYKLWYSRYRYGEFFHITTEYVHTMSNISDKAHGYKNSITLEELIYACGLNSDSGKPFFKDVKLQYELRDYKLSYEKKAHVDAPKIPIENENCTNYESRSDLVFCLYEQDKLKKEYKKEYKKDITIINENKNNMNKFNTSLKSYTFKRWKTRKEFEKNEELKKKKKNNIINLDLFRRIFTRKNQSENKIKFILMFKTHQHNYTFIYIYEGIFYKLVIESNISYILDDIIHELNKKVLSNNFEYMTINFESNNNTFRVVSINILTNKDYNIFFFYNPLIYININSNYLIKDKIDLSVYYENSMLISRKELTIINLYKTDPLIYLNYKNSKYYTEGYITFQHTKKQLEYTEAKYEDELNKCAIKLCSSDDVNLNLSLNYVFYNINDCKYDILEIINNAKNKILLYVFPSIVLTEDEKKIYYIHNFLDLNKKSLPMLKEIKNIYLNKNYMCFLHKTNRLTYNVLHFHLIKKNDYLLNYPEIEKGIFIMQNIYIEDLINNIENQNDYYNKLELKTFNTL